MTETILFSRTQAVLRFISVLLMAVALSLAILAIIQAVFCPFYVIASNSMSPVIETGDAVLMKDVDARNVNVGEVVVFFDPVNKGTLVIHRVVGKNFMGDTPIYTTKGDSNPVADPGGVAPGMIVGAPSRNIPRFGHLLGFLSTPRGYIACVVIPGALSFIIAFTLAGVEKLEKPKCRPEFVVMPTYYSRKLMNLQYETQANGGFRRCVNQ